MVALLAHRTILDPHPMDVDVDAENHAKVQKTTATRREFIELAEDEPDIVLQKMGGNSPWKQPKAMCVFFQIIRWFEFCWLLWLVAMENGPFIDGLPIKNAGFPWRTVK